MLLPTIRTPYRILYTCLLVLGCFLTGDHIRAEPLHPLLSPAAADSLRMLTRRNPPDTNQVQRLLLLGEDFLNKVNIASHLDSADRYCRQARVLSNALRFANGQIRSGYLLGVVTSRRGDAGRAVSLLEEALLLSRTAGNKPLEADGWYYLGLVHDRSAAGLPRKINCYQQSRQRYQQLGNRKKEAYLLKCIADMHFLQGQYPQAYGELLEVLALYRSVGYTRLHYTYDLLVVVNQHMGNYQEALRYGLACVESARAAKDTADISLFYRRLGMLHQELNQPEEGLRFYHKALANYQQEKDVEMILRTARKITAHLLGLGKAREALTFYQNIAREHPPDSPQSTLEAASALAECYLALKQYPAAEKHYRQVLGIDNKIRENGPDKIHNYQRMGNFYLVTGQYGDARHYLDTALHLNGRGGTLRAAMNIHLLLFKVDSAQGKYAAAIAHHQRYKALNDSIFNEKQSLQIAGLQVLHQTREKEQRIRALTREKSMQQAQIRKDQLIRNGVIGAAILSLLLLGVLYNRYRLKQRVNRLLEAKQREINQKNQHLRLVLGEKDSLLVEKESLLTHKDHILLEKDGLLQEKEWLLKEVHHRVKNNLQIVMSLLSSQAAYLLDEKALLAIQESQHRIYAISLIHQRLYLSEKIAFVEMAAYIREVAEYLHDSLQMQDHVRFDLAVEPLELDGAVAVPLGLIVNEAVTNSLKYAFPGGRKGIVAITLTRVDGQNHLLTVADDGIGLAPDFDLSRTRSLGMNLMKGLSKQLGGSLKIESTVGLAVSVRFNSNFRGIGVVKNRLGRAVE